MPKNKMPSYRIERVDRLVWRIIEVRGKQEYTLWEDVHNIVWAKFKKMILNKAMKGELDAQPDRDHTKPRMADSSRRAGKNDQPDNKSNSPEQIALENL